MAEFGKRPSRGEMLLQHLIVFLICIVFPGATTMFAPVSWISFQRSDNVVRCTTRTCAFFVVPFKVQEVNDVTAIEHREKAGHTERKRSHGRTTNETVHVDGEGFLQVIGREGQRLEVSVSPASLSNVADKANNFLASPDKTSTTLFAIANWKFGGIMGGVLSCFTALYVFSYSLAAIQFVFGRLARLFRPPANEYAVP